MDEILRIEGVSKRYKNFLLNNINLSLHKGEIVGIIGENGAGKTTLLRIIMELVHADTGKINFNLENVALCKNEKECIGYLECNRDIYPDAALKEMTHFLKKAYSRNWNQAKFDYYYNDLFKIGSNRKLKELSTGMKVKFYLAIELAKEPELLILDEPTSGLDPMIRNSLLTLLNQISKEEKKTILFSSHITEDIEKIANRIVYLDNGQILLNSDKNIIKNEYKKITVKNLMNQDKILQDYVISNGVNNGDIYIIKCEGLVEKEAALFEEVYLDEVLVYLKKK